MIKAYKYLYFRVYQWQVAVGNAGIADKTSCMLVSIFVFFSYFDIVSYVNLFTGRDIDLGLNYLNTKLKMVIVGTLIFLINYFLLVYNGRYRRIIEQFKQEDESRRKIRTVLLWFYIVGIHFLFFFAMYLAMLRNRGELPFFPLRKY